ncbi:MAG: aminomethyl-transferring glycine dehydrogenase subunit GcvPA [Candidatus Thermoplasmatota archaeon]
MNFIPNVSSKQELLEELHLQSIDELFVDVPHQIRIKNLNLPPGLNQQETEEKLKKIANKNKPCSMMPSFLGGGIKHHYIPAAVKTIVSRSEFYTAYTPYQPEASQGFLQAMFEYQSMICELTGMDVANASLYDGATALGEAALMCSRINNKKTFLVPTNVSWDKRCVLRNYTKGAGITIKEIPYDQKTGKINLNILAQHLDQTVCGVYLENPNFFGVFEDDVEHLYSLIKENNALFVVGVDPISLGIVKNPGEYHADIVIGEGRNLGNSLDFGGSSLGIFACKKEYVRQLPGRIIGLTTDAQGKRAFCMTLQTREQHIRRSKATSNICTNEGLCALTATVYLGLLGGTGLEKLSRINHKKAVDFCTTVTKIPGFHQEFQAAYFNEIVLRTPDARKVNYTLFKHGIHGGLPLETMYPELKNCLLFGVTELTTSEDIDHVSKILSEVF